MTRAQLNERFSPDEISECYDVTDELRRRLWSLVPQDQPVPGENDWPEGHRFKPYPWAEKLTAEEFAAVEKAVEEEDARFDAMLEEDLGPAHTDATSSAYRDRCLGVDPIDADYPVDHDEQDRNAFESEKLDNLRGEY